MSDTEPTVKHQCLQAIVVTPHIWKSIAVTLQTGREMGIIYHAYEAPAYKTHANIAQMMEDKNK